MVAETQRAMSNMFETTAESARVAFDAGLGVQRAWMEAVGQFWKRPGNWPMIGFPSDKLTREFGPFVARNIQTLTECFDTSLRTGTDAFKKACDATLKSTDGEPMAATREVFDVTFAAVRGNVNTAARAGKQAAENWASFCTAAGTEQESGKNAPRTNR